MNRWTIIIISAFLLNSSSSYCQTEMIVPPGTKITIGQGTTLDVGGDRLLLRDDLTTAPSFLQYGNLTFSGSGVSQIQQYLTKDTWHMISSPVNNALNEVYLWHYMAKFNEPDGTWDDINLPLTIPLNTGEGFFAFNYSVDPAGLWPPSPDSVVFEGPLNSTDIPVNLSNTDASPYSGWNLLGNPFPVALEWNGHPDWSLNNVAATMYVYNSVSGNYETWNYNSGGTNPNNGFIAATQAFWVRTADTIGGPASMTIPATQRAHNNASFLKDGEYFLPMQLMLQAEGEGSSDKTIIGFMEEATAGYNTEYDGIYHKSTAVSLSLFSAVQGISYAHNILQSIDEQSSVPLNFKPAESGFYTISAHWLESFETDQAIYFEDKSLGILIDLRKESIYEFFADKNDESDRFTVHFKDENISGDELDYVRIYSWNKLIVVNIPPDLSGTVIVYDLAGKQVLTSGLIPGRNEIPFPGSHGNYIVKVISGNGIKTGKINIQ